MLKNHKFCFRDSKSPASNGVRVQVSPPAPLKIKGLAKNVFAKPFFNEELSLEDALSQLFSPKQKEKHSCLFLVEFLRRDLGMAFFLF